MIGNTGIPNANNNSFCLKNIPIASKGAEAALNGILIGTFWFNKKKASVTAILNISLQI